MGRHEDHFQQVLQQHRAFGNTHGQIDAGFMDSSTEPQGQEQGQHQENRSPIPPQWR